MADTTDQINKPIFSTTNFIMVIGFVASFFANQYSTKMQIQELFLNNKADNRVNDMRFAALENKVQLHDLALQTLAKSMGEMIEVQSPEVKKYRR